MSTPVHSETRTVRAVCAWLGVPARDWDLIATWAADLDALQTRDELAAYVDLMIADRCYRLADDGLSELIRTGVAGLDLTTDELVLAVRAALALAHRAENATPRS
jgi:cytochrome P450